MTLALIKNELLLIRIVTGVCDTQIAVIWYEITIDHPAIEA
jgi:hypothetical protein